jgi:hypothetical protein
MNTNSLMLFCPLIVAVSIVLAPLIRALAVILVVKLVSEKIAMFAIPLILHQTRPQFSLGRRSHLNSKIATVGLVGENVPSAAAIKNAHASNSNTT